MEQELMDILTDLRPDVDFETETALIDDHILESFDIVSLVAAISAWSWPVRRSRTATIASTRERSMWPPSCRAMMSCRWAAYSSAIGEPPGAAAWAGEGACAFTAWAT